MSAISGSEPDHWHDEQGRHRMNDPRAVFGRQWKNTSGNWTSADERAYVRHLIAHEAAEAHPVPEPGDGPQVRALLEKIDVDRAIVERQVQLVHALRRLPRTEGVSP